MKKKDILIKGVLFEWTTLGITESVIIIENCLNTEVFEFLYQGSNGQMLIKVVSEEAQSFDAISARNFKPWWYSTPRKIEIAIVSYIAIARKL